jgi:hypothetical protein
VVDESVVKVLSSEVGVSGGGLDLEDTLLDSEKRNIESSSSQVEDEDISLSLDLLVKTVSDGGSGRLVDDSEDVKTGNDTSILGGLSLRVVEVGGDGDDGVGDGGSEVSLGGLLHLDKDHGGDLLRGLCEGNRSAIRSEDNRLRRAKGEAKRTKSFSSPRYWTCMTGLPSLAKTLKGQCFMSDWTSASANFRPMSRLASKMVLVGF